MIDGQAAKIGARAFDVLLTLIDRRGQLVTKHDLFDAVWPGLVVDENNLVVQVCSLRKLLGPEVIATIPGRGYRFAADEIGQRREADTQPETAAPQPASAASALPETLPALIGREDDLVALNALLPLNRLITLVGAGGIGKTRVARQLLHDQRRAGKPIAWIELASLVGPGLVTGCIASGLGVQTGAGDPLKGLANALRRSSLLLALDNAEHVADDVSAAVEALLAEASGIRVLVTSQVGLRLPGERVYRLGALDGPSDDVSLEDAQSFGAVSLFVKRAQEADRRFALTRDNVAAVVNLCARLDGLPLAIELAAARVPLLGVVALADALDHRLSLLTAGRRGAPQRQATLRGALEWSHSLLSSDEQAVFRRLSVFAGSFTLEAARRLAAGTTAESDAASALGEWEVVDALGALVDRSLVAANTAALPRYRLLESPRALAVEKLLDAGEADAYRRRHAELLIEQLEGASDDWGEMSDRDWSVKYPVEVDDLRVALDWALGERGDRSLGVELTASSARLWMSLSLYDEGLSRLNWALNCIGTQTPPLCRLWLWRSMGIMQMNRDPGQALLAFERAVDLQREISGRPVRLAEMLVRYARACAGAGRLADSKSALEESLPIVCAHGSVHSLAGHAEVCAFVSKLAGDPASARRQYEDALLLFRRAGDRIKALGMLDSLADTAWAEGDLDRALSGFREVIAALRTDPSSTKGRLGVSLTNLAGVHVERGEIDDALSVAREGLPLRQEAGFAWGALDHLALLAALSGRPADAARITGYADAVFASKRAERQPNEARARARLAVVLGSQLDDVKLRRLAEEGEALSEERVCELALDP